MATTRIKKIESTGEEIVTAKGVRTVRQMMLKDDKESDRRGYPVYKPFESEANFVNIKQSLYRVTDENDEVYVLTAKQAKRMFSPRQFRMALKRHHKETRPNWGVHDAE